MSCLSFKSLDARWFAPLIFAFTMVAGGCAAERIAAAGAPEPRFVEYRHLSADELLQVEPLLDYSKVRPLSLSGDAQASSQKWLGPTTFGRYRNAMCELGPACGSTSITYQTYDWLAHASTYTNEVGVALTLDGVGYFSSGFGLPSLFYLGCHQFGVYSCADAEPFGHDCNGEGSSISAKTFHTAVVAGQNPYTGTTSDANSCEPNGDGGGGGGGQTVPLSKSLSRSGIHKLACGSTTALCI